MQRHPGSSPSVGGVDVTSLVADPTRPADVRVQLTARRGPVSVPGGRALEGYTVNGTSPGPTVRAHQGDLVEVTFVNESVTDGATLHWHGIDVTNAADGVAGVTQDAVPVGGRFVYRFVAKDAGTYWYHSHQMSHEQVERGLFGAVVILPGDGTGRGRDGRGRSGAGRGGRGAWGRGRRRGRPPARLRGAAHPQRVGAGRPRERRCPAPERACAS